MGRKDAGDCVYLLKSPSLWKVIIDYRTVKGAKLFFDVNKSFRI